MIWKPMRWSAAVALVGVWGAGAAMAAGQTVELTPAKDNTLYESSTGSLSNGAGNHIFAGLTGMGSIRRALLEFDVSTIPPGSTVTSVELSLYLTQTIVGPKTVSLHRALAEWGEGTSHASGEEGMGTAATAGDATWLHTYYPDQFWDAPGGDYVSQASSSLKVGSSGLYTWPSTPELVADVQAWVDDASANHGWIVIGDETFAPTAKRFDSSETTNPAFVPTLVISFDPPVTTCPGDLTEDGSVGVADLLELLGAWGPCDGCPADLDRDDAVGVSDLLELLGNWGACA